MDLKGEWGSALAVTAAIVGAGFASGREIVTFFSCTGWASWIGIAIACALIGALTAMLAEFVRRTGARSFPGIYARAMNRACGDSVQVLHGITMLLTASVMLTAGGELGALTLPLHNAYPVSMAGTLLLAVLLIRRRLQALSWMGMLLVPLVCIYYFCLAIDPAPAPVRALNDAGMSEMPGNVAAAGFLGMLYAALNAAMSGGVTAAQTRPGTHPKRLGLLVALMLLAMLIPANAALLRAGVGVRRLALPGVVLAARWGSAGFYVSAFIMWMSVVTTLAAALGSIGAQAQEVRLNPRTAVCLASLMAACLSVVGFRGLVQVGYPLLGWACTLILLALVPFLPEEGGK